MLSMPLITLVTGGLLIGCWLIGAVASGLRDLEVMVACLFGGLLLVTGFLAREGDLRKLSMHLAAVLGLIGAIASLALLIRAKPDVSKAAVIIHTITMILCAEYVALCVASFVKARKAMAEKGDEPEEATTATEAPSKEGDEDDQPISESGNGNKESA